MTAFCRTPADRLAPALLSVDRVARVDLAEALPRPGKTPPNAQSIAGCGASCHKHIESAPVALSQPILLH